MSCQHEEEDVRSGPRNPSDYRVNDSRVAFPHEGNRMQIVGTQLEVWSYPSFRSDQQTSPEMVWFKGGMWVF